MFTSASIVLAVGLDPAITNAHQRPTRAGGVFLHTATTPADAVTMLQTGDFDLVLLGSSLPPESRRRLVSAIRSFGLTLPVAYVADGQDSCKGCATCEACADSTVLSPTEPIAVHVKTLLADGRGKESPTRPLTTPLTMRRFEPRSETFLSQPPRTIAAA